MAFVIWFLDVFASFVHFLGTGLCSFNKIFILLIKKKKKKKKTYSMALRF